MATLMLSMNGLELKEIELAKPRLTIGRAPHNDIQIDHRLIAGEHAAIVSELAASFLENLGDLKGTLLNGQPVQKHLLRDGDVITLGKYTFTYRSTQQSPVQTAAAESQPKAAIRLLNGPNAGKTLALLKPAVTLGKPGGQVAVITRRGGAYSITHVEGSEFPRVNEQSIDTRAHPLNDHDVLELAGIRMEFFLTA